MNDSNLMMPGTRASKKHCEHATSRGVDAVNLKHIVSDFLTEKFFVRKNHALGSFSTRSR